MTSLFGGPAIWALAKLMLMAKPGRLLCALQIHSNLVQRLAYTWNLLRHQVQSPVSKCAFAVSIVEDHVGANGALGLLHTAGLKSYSQTSSFQFFYY